MKDINLLVLEALEKNNYYRNGELDDMPFQDMYNAFPFRARNPENKVSAPELAYKTLYGKLPVNKIGVSNYPDTKVWNNMIVGKELEDEWLNQLNSIKHFELRAICQGYSSDRVAYVIFRISPLFKGDLQKIIDNFKQYPQIKVGSDIGNNKMTRLCVTGKIWFTPGKDNSKAINWWTILPQYISKAVS